MALTPGLQLPFGIQPVNAVPAVTTYGPYATIAEAKSSVLQAIRHDGLTVKINGLGEYWWLAADLTDSGLIPKQDNLIAQTYFLERDLPNTGPSYIELGSLQPLLSFGLTNLIEVYIHGSNTGTNSYTPLYQKYSLPTNFWIATNGVWNTLEPDLYTGLSASWEQAHRMQWMQNSGIISLRCFARFGGRGTRVKIKIADYAPLGFNQFIESTGTGTGTDVNLLGSFATRFFLAGGIGVIKYWVDSWFNVGKALIFGDANAYNSYVTKIYGGANTADVTMILPTVPGTAGQVIATDGAGQLSFVNNGTSGGGLYTTDLLVSLSGVRTAGKYASGQTIPRIGKTMQEVMDDMYQETLFPSLNNPSIGGVSFNIGTLLEVGTLIPTLTASTSFNRGSINPQYTSASNLRSGLPNNHLFTGPGGFTGNTASTSLSPSKSISNYSIASGSNTFGIQVAYDAGVQPKDSAGNNFSSPLAAGSTGVSNGTITGAYLRFHGSSTSVIPNTSAAVRVLTNTFNNTFSIVIPAGNTRIFFYYPATIADITDGSVKYVEGFNANVGNIFTKTTINVNDAGGVPVSYKMYSATLPAPESSNITYNVTL